MRQLLFWRIHAGEVLVPIHDFIAHVMLPSLWSGFLLWIVYGATSTLNTSSGKGDPASA